MWLFGRNRRKTDAKEAEIHAIHVETLQKMEEATQKTEEVNKMLARRDTAYLVFLATGGERRSGGKR